MIETKPISTDHLIRALRVYVLDLSDKYRPFEKGEDYLHELAGWIAEAANRLEEQHVKLKEVWDSLENAKSQPDSKEIRCPLAPEYRTGYAPNTTEKPV